MTATLPRRAVLGAAAALVADALVGGCEDGRDTARSPVDPAAPTPVQRWPGHQPGQIYLGVSQRDPDLTDLERRVGALGAHRSFFDFWSWAAESVVIDADHAAHRISWVSFKPPTTQPGGWSQLASGAVDSALRARARTYADKDSPVIVTFHHEPSNDQTGDLNDFAAAFARAHDVMADETGLSGVAFVPVLGDWEFNPVNEGGRSLGFLTDRVLDRASFLGVDIYQNASGAGYDDRLGRILTQLDRRGRTDMMLGVGETGCTDAYGTSAERWWEDSWRWATRGTDRVGVVSYFNSTRNSRPEVYWPLDESPAKLAAFRASVTSGYACRLP